MVVTLRYIKYIYIYLKIEYQSETDFIYHENLRFKKKEKSLRKIKESKRMTRHKGTYIKSQNKVHTVGRKKLLKQIYIHILNTYSS